LRPGFRPRVNQHEPKPVVLEAWITANYAELALDAEEVFTTEIESEAILRNEVAAIAAPLPPSAMLGLPVLRAILLPGAIPLPTATLP
jgi:hypothetical protein